MSEVSHAPAVYTVRPKPIRSLTGLRGIAAVFVVVFHFAQIYRSQAEPDWSIRQFISHGYLSVDLFFVLSGFVLALNYNMMLRGDVIRLYQVFLGHRLARIYPLYFCVTIFAGVVHGTGISGSTILPHFPATLLANVLMIQSWGLAQSLVWPAWSISTEWAAYLLFPLLVACTLRANRWTASITAIICIACVLMLAWGDWWGIGFDVRTGPLDLWAHQSAAPIVRCLAEFTLGLLTFRLFHTASERQAAVMTTLCPLVAVAVLLLMCVSRTDVAIVLLLPALILGLAWDRGVLAKLLASKLPFGLGILSYSVYLVHPYLAHIVDAAEPWLAGRGVDNARIIALVPGTIMTVGAATCVFRFVERPGRRLVRVMADRLLASR